MPFDHGTLTLTIFELRADLPEDAVELFAARKAGSLDSVSTEADAEPQIGWVTGRYLLDNQIDESSAHRGSFLALALRRAERKIPASLLNAICRREEHNYLLTHQAEFIPSKIRKSIREEAIERHLPKMPPALSAIPLVIDPVEKVLYLGAASNAQIDLFIENFFQTTKVEPLQMTPASLLERLFEITESSFPALRLTDGNTEERSIGRDFLTWLWFLSENDGRITHDQYGEFDLLIEGPLAFADLAEANGAEETVIKKGNSPARSAEAKAALAVGKKLKKAKLSLTRGEEIWCGAFDADKFSFGSLKLPEGNAMSPDERFIERIEFLNIFKAALELYFRKFAETMLAAHYPDTEKKLRKWAAERDAI